MPRLRNKKTGAEYDVTPQELEKIKATPGMARAFEITEANVPDEVKALQEQKSEVEEKAESVTKKAKGKK